MASIEGGDGGGHKKGPGVKKAKKLSTRVDMTPMVDLGFLLITFFIFTATLSTPSTMDLNVPKDTDKDEEQTKAKQSGALTIMLGKNNNVYYYEGELSAEGFKQTTFKGIRDIIIKKKRSVIAAYTGSAACEEKARAKKLDVRSECADEDFVVVIKPMPDATYKNTVDILDEMTINQVKRFAMVKIADSEKELIVATEGPSTGTTPAP
ncbi:MAG: biopolymer transporter ExbD [Chitinophagaceae bacterium]|nr:MAG: biopolymer transporter ExbD [Chitinophagaceae bacterium]